MKKLLTVGLLFFSVNSFAGMCDTFMYNWSCKGDGDSKGKEITLRLMTINGVSAQSLNNESSTLFDGKERVLISKLGNDTTKVQAHMACASSTSMIVSIAEISGAVGNFRTERLNFTDKNKISLSIYDEYVDMSGSVKKTSKRRDTFYCRKDRADQYVK